MSRNEAATTADPETARVNDASHAHRWRIDEQAGALSTGHCDCGQEQAFNNGWDGDLSVRLRGGGWMDRRSRDARAAE